MIPARSVARSALPRAARNARGSRSIQHRLQSTSASSSSSTTTAAGSSSSHLAAGVAGGIAAAGVLYATYLYTPSGRLSSTLNKTAIEANKKYQEAAKKFQQSTPDADQTIDYIKEFAYSYVSWVPGGRQYVDAAFKDVEVVRKNHKEEADKILNDAYRQFQQVAKSGLSLETATRAAEVLADVSKKLADLAGDALSDVLDNHPEIKDKFGGSIDQLKQLGDQYGPEAKKEIDRTWKEVKDVFAGGFSAASLAKAKQLVDDKIEQVQKLGNEAWSKGLEEAKPLLDKNPKIKELVEKNADALKKGNVKELFDSAKKAVESGDSSKFEEYISGALDKAKSKGSELGLDKYLDMLPQGGDMMEKLKQLKEVAEKHAEEGEALLKETAEELKKVLEDKAKKAQDIADKAGKESKSKSK